jgi:hypothetical protein
MRAGIIGETLSEISAGHLRRDRDPADTNRRGDRIGYGRSNNRRG